METLERTRGFLRLTRPLNVVFAGLLTAIGAFVAGGAMAAPQATVAGSVATAAAVAAGNALNDYFDREVDAVNRPDRPIPSGSVSPRGAIGFATAAFILAVALALTLPRLAIIIAGINLLALVLYTELFKGLPGVGNAVVSYLGGSTFLFGAAAVNELGSIALVLGALAALATFSREVIKDVEDKAGDAAESLRTLPIVVGDRYALLIATVAVVIGVLASPVPYLLDAFGTAYLVFLLPADFIMLYAVRRAFVSPSQGQYLLKLGMIVAASAFVLGRLSQLQGWPA